MGVVGRSAQWVTLVVEVLELCACPENGVFKAALPQPRLSDLFEPYPLCKAPARRPFHPVLALKDSWLASSHMPLYQLKISTEQRKLVSKTMPLGQERSSAAADCSPLGVEEAWAFLG